LPEGTTLEPVEVKTDGHTLDEVRAKIETLESELKVLRGLPHASADIESRLRTFVESQARPVITGIGKNETLRILFPGCGWDNSGPKEHKAEALTLLTFLFPDVFVSRLMHQIEDETSKVIPIKDRAARAAQIEDGLVELAYVEEALVTAAIADGKDVQRSPNALPQAVLQVRVAEATKSSRTA
jgi:hypothetical protein